MPTAQQRFNETYISSKEILDRLQVSRPTISSARRRGLLPDPVVISDTVIYLWERTTVEPFIAAWQKILEVKRAPKG